MTGQRHFTPATFSFLKELAANNNREWFQQNKHRYENHLRDPAVRFITDFGVRLKKISKHFRADPRPVGGSMFRIYRDTRFSKDKSPYKTYSGIQFRHELAKDAHAPGFYLHIQPGEYFAAVGIWHPDSPTLKKIRDRIVEDSSGWKRSARGKRFTSRFELQGDSLKRPPKGYDAEHPLIDDLKRKDFIGVTRVTQKSITGAGFLDDFEDLCRDGTPLVRYLCKALNVPY